MIPKYKPYFNLDEIRSILTCDFDAVKIFENKFANIVGAKYALSFPYGRSGLYAILQSNKIYNSEVIIPAYTCVVVANSIINSGNIPKFVDITLKDYNMDLELLDEAITKKTKMIIPTHMFGLPVNVKHIIDILADKNKDDILVVEDACLAPLAKNVGKHSDATFYSFNIGKHIVTLDGGMVTTNNELIYNRLKKYREEHFYKPSLLTSVKKMTQTLSSYIIFNKNIYTLVYWLWKHSKFLKKMSKNWDLNETKIPDNFLNLFSLIQAKLGLSQINKITKIIKRRIENATVYYNELQDVKGIILPPLVNGAVYSHYSIRVKSRDNFEKQMERRRIHVGRTFDYSIPNLSAYKRYALTSTNKKSYKNSQTLANEIINLPVYPSLSVKEIKHISNNVREIQNEVY